MNDIWTSFAQNEQLSPDQVTLFQRYAELLVDWNSRMNLTALTELQDIVHYHFQDSLRLADAIDLSAVQSIADIGSGAGFPGIPLAIRFPDISVVLIEVNSKRIRFLQEVITQLGLEGVTICSSDWRTFVRQAPVPVELFCARASLAPEELLRALRPGSAYHDSMVVYFASQHWEPSDTEKPLILSTYPYQVGIKKRELVLFGHEVVQKLVR